MTRQSTLNSCPAAGSVRLRLHRLHQVPERHARGRRAVLIAAAGAAASSCATSVTAHAIQFAERQDDFALDLEVDGRRDAARAAEPAKCVAQPLFGQRRGARRIAAASRIRTVSRVRRSSSPSPMRSTGVTRGAPCTSTDAHVQRLRAPRRQCAAKARAQPPFERRIAGLPDPVARFDSRRNRACRAESRAGRPDMAKMRPPCSSSVSPPVSKTTPSPGLSQAPARRVPPSRGRRRCTRPTKAPRFFPNRAPTSCW